MIMPCIFLLCTVIQLGFSYCNICIVTCEGIISVSIIIIILLILIKIMSIIKIVSLLKIMSVKKVSDNAVLLGTYCILLLCVVIYLAFSYCYICIVTIKKVL